MKRFSAIILFLATFMSYAQDLKLSPLSVDPELSKGADSVLMEEIVNVDVTDYKTQKHSIRRVMTVYNKTGLSDVRAAVGYDDNTVVKYLEATVYDLSGKKIKTFHKRDFKDVSAVGSGTLYSDSRVMYLDYTPSRYPFTIVFESEEEHKTTVHIPSWSPVRTYESSTIYAEYNIYYNPDSGLHVKETNLDAISIERVEDKGHKRWIARNIPAVKWEALAPSFWDQMPTVKCTIEHFALEGVEGYAADWQTFGQWMNEKLLHEGLELPQNTIDEIKKYTAGALDDEERARLVYQYVQDKVRYISVQIGIGGWKPMAASDVDRLGYGDCKALTYYTKSLLEAVDVPSYYTFLYAGREKESIEEDIIALQGNHAILAVPLNDEITFLECTDQQVPFGYMGSFTDDRDVVMITPEGGKMVRTTKYDLEDNLIQSKANLELDALGAMKGAITIHSSGVRYAEKMSLKYEDEKEIKDYYLTLWGHVNEMKIDSFKLKDHRDEVLFEEEVEFMAPNYAKKIGDNFILKPNVFVEMSETIPPRYTARRTPFIINRSSVNRQETVFKLPQDYQVSFIPEPVTIKSDFGLYTISIELLDNNELKYQRELQFFEGNYVSEKYEDYRSFLKSIASNDQLKLEVTKIK